MWSGLQIKWLISIQKCKIALKCVKYLNFFWKLHLFKSLSKKVREKGTQMECLVSIHFDSNFECKMFWWWIDDNLFLQNGWTMKAVKPYLSRSHCQNIANIWRAATRIWTCEEPEFWACWMKVCSSDSHYIMVMLCKICFERHLSD